MNKLHPTPVSPLINEADDTAAAAEMRNEHAPADANVHTSVEYIGNNVISTEAPTKITDIVFFGIVKGW